jgi:phage FluMu gp28-like protein
VLFKKRIEVMFNTDFQTQFDTICQIIYEESPASCLIDKGVIGMQLAEMLEKKFGFCKGVQFNPLFINEIVTNGKKLMEQGNFRIDDDRDLVTQFHSIQRVVTPQNTVKFSSERNKKGHSDKAWSALLALQATKNEVEFKMGFVDN